MNQIIRKSRILIVDDNAENVAVIEQMLRKAGYQEIECTTDSRQAVSAVERLQPDMLILDLFMPAPDGFAVLDQLTLSPTRDKLMAILVLTGDAAPASKVKALSMGARDFLTKPVDRVDVLLRTRTLLEWRYAQKEALEEKARRRAAEKIGRDAGAGADLMDRLAVIVECLDPERAQHGLRVAELAAQIASELNLDETTLGRIRSVARLFDLGMLTLPETIRKSRAPLSAEERLLMTSHTLAAKRMFGGTSSPALEMAKDIALSHHERWDGSGYPLGSKGTETPLAARIVAVAHVFDALITERPYRPAMQPEEAVAEVKRQAGYAFDPEVVAAFLRTRTEVGSVSPEPVEAAN
jgi:putative two-component system response regulator